MYIPFAAVLVTLLTSFMYREGWSQSLVVYQPPNEGIMRTSLQYIGWALDKAVGVSPNQVKDPAPSPTLKKPQRTPKFVIVTTKAPVPTYFPILKDYNRWNPPSIQYSCRNIPFEPFEPVETREEICLPDWIRKVIPPKEVVVASTDGAVVPWTPPATSSPLPPPPPPPPGLQDLSIALVSTIVAGFAIVVLLLALMVNRERHHRQEKVTIRHERDKARAAIKKDDDDVRTVEQKAQVLEQEKVTLGHEISALGNDNKDLKQKHKVLEHSLDESTQKVSSLSLSNSSLEDKVLTTCGHNAQLTAANTHLEEEKAVLERASRFAENTNASLMTQVMQLSSEAEAGRTQLAHEKVRHTSTKSQLNKARF